jgi:ATP-dependent 26S proteasome regulatory subunit
MILDVLRERIQCRFPLLFLTTWEEERWENEIASMSLDMDLGMVTWTSTEGASPPIAENDNTHLEPEEFLKQVRKYPKGTVFLLKDFHPYLDEPRVVRILRDLIPTLTEQQKTILLMSPGVAIPVELRKDAITIELPLPGIDELREELKELLIQRQYNGETVIRMTVRQEERLLKTVLGLTCRQARQSLSRALLGRREIDDDVYSMLISEKKNMVSGSDLLEFYELAEGVDDIGGLDSLKDWIAKRGEAFSENARKKGIPAPKGVLLLGVQGCGKSLTARAVARMLSFPLVRLDVSTLLTSEQGGSEKNLRDVLHLTEMIAPAVLWMDEVEKGFAGADAEGGGEATMTRLMGRFLTWMQEKKASVFVVATANSVHGLPPEMLRRGRFDELFFVDLPNYHERKAVFEIHFKKNNLPTGGYNLGQLADQTEGYSGAEIEQVILTSMVEAYNRKESLVQQVIEQSIIETVPLSVTMEEKIFELREWAKTRCRPATPDSRVLQMLEEEHRDKTGQEEVGVLDLIDEEDLPSTEQPGETWQSMAAEGQVRTALLEYVSQAGEVTFANLQNDFTDHVESNGEFGLALRSDPHVVLWHGMSADIAAPLARLISDRKIYVYQVASSEYGDYAKQVPLPKIPAMSDNRVSKPCWLPVSICTVPPEEVDERLCRVARMQLNRPNAK